VPLMSCFLWLTIGWLRFGMYVLERVPVLSFSLSPVAEFRKTPVRRTGPANDFDGNPARAFH
jgi:hypothetical protein